MKQRGILKLPTYKLIPHPENPRKDLGDLSEMTESIKKHGILQNLTVVPVDCDGKETDTDHADKYMVIIGHRRLAAAKAAGIEEVPARIVEDMTHDEQLLTMLEENMQRSDLTIYDQAQGFQLMLDLGQTIEDIEEKSGFSKTTIYHRLNIAKLDKEKLKEKQDDDSFQLSLTDLIELEKLKDIDKRNEILSKARSSSELRYMAKTEAEQIEKNLKFDYIISFLEGQGINKLPDGIYSWNCDTVYSIPLDDFDPETIDGGEDMYYQKGYDKVLVLTPRVQKETKGQQSPKNDSYEKLRVIRDKIREADNRLRRVRKDAFINIAKGELTPECKEEIAGKALWQALMSVAGCVDLEGMTEDWMTINDIDQPEDPEEAEEVYEDCRNQVFNLSFPRQCALILSDECLTSPINEYKTGYIEEDAQDTLRIVDTALRNYGFVAPEEEKTLYDPENGLIKELREAKEDL